MHIFSNNCQIFITFAFSIITPYCLSMKKLFSFFLIIAWLSFAIQLTSCKDKTDSPEVPEIPENPENPRDEAYYDSYIETVENLASQLNNGTITTNGQLIEFAKNYDNFKSVTEQDGVVYLEFDGGWTYFVDFDGRTAVSPIAEEDIDFSEFDELLSQLEEFDNAEPEDYSRSDVQESRAATNPEYLPSKFKVLYWGPFDNGADASNCYGQICKRLKYNIGTANESLIDYDAVYGDQCSISDFSKFSDYDIVIFATHGCKGGMPLVPNTMKGISSLSDRLSKGWVQNIECTALDYNLLSKKLPALGNTVVWTLMCYSFCENSTMASVAKLKSVGDYFGATERINGLINYRLFIPFIARLYRGASSVDAFLPNGHRGYEYTLTDDGEQIKGVYGHSGFDGVCFPLTGADKAVDNSPVATFQAPSGELDKVLKGNGSFKAGIEVKNTSTSKITKIELTSDNISASSHKEWEHIIDRNKYTFKTDGLEDGTYEYRSYIEFPNGEIRYSENTETFTIGNNASYFEVYYEGETEVVIEYLAVHDYIQSVVCNDKPIDFVRESLLATRKIKFNSNVGYNTYKIFYSCKFEDVFINSVSTSNFCGGYIPSMYYIRLEEPEQGSLLQEISNAKRGAYTLTVPNINHLYEYKISSLKSIDISGCSSLKAIGSSSNIFKECPNLNTVNLSGCTKLESIKFQNCPSLKYVNLSGCTKLESIEFQKCYSLKSLGLTESESINISGCTSLSSIGNFCECTSLKYINLSDCESLEYIGPNAFRDCTSLESVNFSGCAKLEYIYSNAFMDCTSLKSVNLSNCSNLKEFIRANWEYGVFYGCSSLNSIDLRGCSNLTYIGRETFFNCYSLGSIDLSDCTNLIGINSGAFCNCISLSYVNISNCSNLKDIEICAFANCKMSEIVIPQNVDYIHYDAFLNTPIKLVHCYAITPRYSNPFPDDVNNYAKIYVPASSVEIYKKEWGVWEEDDDGFRTNKCLNIFPM